MCSSTDLTIEFDLPNRASFYTRTTGRPSCHLRMAKAGIFNFCQQLGLEPHLEFYEPPYSVIVSQQGQSFP